MEVKNITSRVFRCKTIQFEKLIVSIKTHFSARLFFFLCFDKVDEECELWRLCCLGVHQELRVPCSELILAPICSTLGVDITSSAVNLQLITNVLSKSIALNPVPPVL